MPPESFGRSRRVERTARSGRTRNGKIERASRYESVFVIRMIPLLKVTGLLRRRWRRILLVGRRGRCFEYNNAVRHRKNESAPTVDSEERDDIRAGVAAMIGTRRFLRRFCLPVLLLVAAASGIVQGDPGPDSGGRSRGIPVTRELPFASGTLGEVRALSAKRP